MQNLIITLAMLVVLVVAGLLFNAYLKHQNDKDPITGTTITPPALSDEQPVDPPTLKVKKDANTDITNPPQRPYHHGDKKAERKGTVHQVRSTKNVYTNQSDGHNRSH